MLSIPPELKKISPYIRRAEELDKETGVAESRLVAYYCRQYAVHAGIPLASSSSAAKECLGILLGMLEQEKPTMDNFTREEAKFLCQSFAERVFDKADDEDRLGTANKSTAKTFYAAASFLQMLEQFMEPGDPEMDEIKKKVVYSKWKSTEILKAIKEGRTPTPGGYGEEDQGEEVKEEKEETPADEPGQIPKVETVDEDDDAGLLPPPPPMPPTAPMEPPAGSDEDVIPEEGTEVALEPPPPYPGPYPGEATTETSTPTSSFVVMPPPPSPPTPAASRPSPPTTSPASRGPPPPAAVQAPKAGGIFGFGKKNNNNNNGKPTKAQLADAMELTRFALAALDEKDADVAAQRLQQALQVLGR